MHIASRLTHAARRHPTSLLLGIVAIASVVYALSAPFLAARYAPMTDLPFHAAQATGIVRHFDPTYHFRDQFDLQPFVVPYLSMYVLAGLASFLMPPWMAIKLAAFVMLALLPAGLAVMFWGMKKSPLLGLLGIPFAWTHLTHWGFLNFIGAVGLFVMTVGLTLRLLDRPTTGKQVALAITLILLFFTHIYRFPFGVLAVFGTAVVMYPATRRLRPILLPTLPSLILFAIWLRIRPSTISVSGFVHPTFGRLQDLVPYLLEPSFDDGAETKSMRWAFAAVAFVGLACAIVFLVERRFALKSRREKMFDTGTTLVSLGLTCALLLMFLILPMTLGNWWYVYPREAITACFVALGLWPDLPRARLLRASLVFVLALAPMGLVQAIVANYEEFDEATQDYHQITRHLPQAPKLLYLIFDHTGSRKKHSAFIHLPGYVQAERGGWLSYHFAIYGASPLAFRLPHDPQAVLPPRIPGWWEHTPEKFRIFEQGTFFDWFLVRRRHTPSDLFAADPTISLVDHVGSWWLFQRNKAGPLSNR